MRNAFPVPSTQQPKLTGISVAGPVEAWEGVGFTCGGAGFQAGDVSIAFSGAGRAGLWFDRETGALEGLAAPSGAAMPAMPTGAHPNHAIGVDHVVVSSPNFARTSATLEAAGMRCLGERSAEIDGRMVEQRFHHAGSCLVELVGQQGVMDDGEPRIWGITFVTSDIESLPALQPPPVASIRDAVQPGRRIATVVREAGLPLPVAFMDPRVAQ